MGIWDNLTGLFTGEPALEAEANARAARAAGFGEASKYLTEGTEKASQYFNTATGRWEPLVATAKSGYDAAADASGANGPEGLARARAAYESSGAYGTGLTRSNDEIQRRMASMGLSASSNNLQAVSDNTADLMQKGYFTYANNLMPWLQQANTVAGAQSGIDVGQGGLWQSHGAKLGDWRTGQATADASSYSKEGDIKLGAGKNLFEGIMGGLKLAGNIIAPGSGELANFASKGGAVGKGTNWFA